MKTEITTAKHGKWAWVDATEAKAILSRFRPATDSALHALSEVQKTVRRRKNPDRPGRMLYSRVDLERVAPLRREKKGRGRFSEGNVEHQTKALALSPPIQVLKINAALAHEHNQSTAERAIEFARAMAAEIPHLYEIRVNLTDMTMTIERRHVDKVELFGTGAPA